MSLDRELQTLWYERRPLWLLLVLLPLSALFAVVTYLRRVAYSSGLLRSIRVSRPVIVIGNITVGGTGKTPFVGWLAGMLQAKGRRVGIVIRGYGGQSLHWPRDVLADTSYTDVGDEAVLLAKRTQAIVVAGPDRVAAAQRAIERGADVILSDDGMQHYRLARDCEIAVISAGRGVGNGLPLPAGPLREPQSRLETVNLLVMTERQAGSGAPSVAAGVRSITVRGRLMDAVSLIDGKRRPLESFRAAPVHAVAGIGHPEAFFEALRATGLQVDARALSDHAALQASDIMFADSAPVLMTEKDAVKCRAIADERHWAVPLELELNAADAETVLAVVAPILDQSSTKQALI